MRLLDAKKDPPFRQVGESVRIDMRVGVLNSKTVFSRNTLPRLVLDKSEKEKKKEEMDNERKKQEEKDKREHWLKNFGTGYEGSDVEIDRELDSINEETWELELVEKEKGRKRLCQEILREEFPRPQKKKKKERVWRKKETYDWGLKEIEEVEVIPEHPHSHDDDNPQLKLNNKSYLGKELEPVQESVQEPVHETI